MFQRCSQSSAALHDFTTKSEVQPPNRHGVWCRMLFRSNVYHSQSVYPRELKRFAAARNTYVMR